ncbi:MAG TPA: beta-phosphoglucomutase [Saprospiraceae bacterium]|nr:beta-phosphoglucomutase [Saprospiraceae bacterium]
MRVLLIDIENHFDHFLLREGMDLVRASTEYTIQQPDQAHFQVNSSNPAYQVDLLMGQDGMVNAKCYCAQYKKQKKCKHIVAALLLLRDHLQHARKLKNKARNDDTVIDEALRKIKITDLRRFISNYANSHSTFKSELLANTLHLTKKPDYLALLLDVIPIDKYGQIKINRNNVKTLRSIIAILLKQAQQLFKEKALPETFQILEPLISHLYRLINKFPQYAQPLLIDLKTALKLFEALCLQPMAPRLQQAAIKFATELSSRDSYFFVKSTLPVLQSVEPFVLEQKMRTQLSHLADQKIVSDTANAASWATLLLRWGNRWHLKLKSKAIFKELIPLMPTVILELNQQKEYADLLYVLRLMPEKNMDRTMLRNSYHFGLKAALILDAEEDILQIATALSNSFFDIDAWEVLYKNDASSAQKIIHQLQHQFIPGQNEMAERLILHGLKVLHEYEILVDRLTNLQDAQLMMEYDEILVKHQRDPIIRFYAAYIQEIREAYGGTIARQKLHDIFSHLKALDISSAVSEKIKQMDKRKVENEKNNHNHNVIAGFVFDLDGVIVDTAIHHFAAWKKLMKEIGVEIRDEDDHHTRGASRMESLEYLLNRYGVIKTGEEKAELAARKNEYYLKSIEEITPSDLLPGALQFLEDTKKAGLRLALGSASKNARGVLSKLEIEDRFDAILDGNDAKESKPDPEIFIKASEALQLDPERVVVFEDAAKGVQAALAAGCHCVGLGDASTLGAADIVIPGLFAATPQQIIEQLS